MSFRNRNVKSSSGDIRCIMQNFLLLIVIISGVSCKPRPQSQPDMAQIGDPEYPTVELVTFPNGLRFPKWLPHPASTSEFYGNLNLQKSLLHGNLQFNTNTMLSNYPTTPVNQPTLFPLNFYSIPVITSNNLGFHQRNQQTSELKKSIEILMSSPTKQSNGIVTSDEAIAKLSDLVKQKLEEMKQKVQGTNSEQSLAPYRAHPLLHYLKNNNTISKENIISFRNDLLKDQAVTTLILKPVARAIAGADGRAISTPVSRAVLRPGTNVDVLFEPDAIAVAGPGGIAHAESDLEITYEDEDYDAAKIQEAATKTE